MAKHAAVLRGSGRRRSATRPGRTGEKGASRPRDRQRLPTREEVPSQNRVRHRHLVLGARGYTRCEALIMATSTNAELLALSGLRNPYPGKLGVVEEGALADLLVVDGNPLENLDLVRDPERNFKLIMKGGGIYKNTLSPSMALGGSDR